MPLNDRRMEKMVESRQVKITYKSIGELTEQIKEKIDKNTHPKLQALKELWPEIIGSELADLAFPYAVRDDILIVSVTTSSVKFTIEQMHKQVLLEQSREILGKYLRDIKCTLKQ